MTPYYDRDGIVIFNDRCEDILPTIDPASVALLIADPPYGVNEQTDRNRRGRGFACAARDWDRVEGDDKPFDPAHLLCFPRIVLFGANHYASRLPDSGAWIVWDRLNGSVPMDNADCELAWTNLGGTTRMYRQCWQGFRREDDGLDPQKHLHPTQKPTKIMMWLLNRYTRPGDLVLDPYMGSGPIAKACQLLGRRYIGIETVEAYCRVTVDTRLAQQVLPLEMAG